MAQSGLVSCVSNSSLGCHIVKLSQFPSACYNFRRTFYLFACAWFPDIQQSAQNHGVFAHTLPIVGLQAYAQANGRSIRVYVRRAPPFKMNKILVSFKVCCEPCSQQNVNSSSLSRTITFGQVSLSGLSLDTFFGDLALHDIADVRRMVAFSLLLTVKFS